MFTPFSKVSNPYLVNFHQTAKPQSNEPGWPGYGLVFGQNGSFPFHYDQAFDYYTGYRWDYDDLGQGMRLPLTQEIVNSLDALYLTSHPHFFSALHLECPSRLTEVRFKLPTFLQVEIINGIVEESWNKNPSEPAKYNLTQVGQQLVNSGYNAFYMNHQSSGSPELLLIDPKIHILGCNWYDFKQGELKKALFGLTIDQKITQFNP